MSDEVADTEENVELPDDFFDEFEDSNYLDEMVDIVAPEQTRLIRTDDTIDNKSTEASNADKSNNDKQIEDQPILKRCLKSLESLTESIKNRKERLRNEVTTNADNKRKHRRSHSPTSSRAERNGRSRSSRRSPSGPKIRRDRSRSRDRHRSRDRRRRDRSRSESPSSRKTNGMSFLEELEQKFASQGKDFPEMKLLMELRAKKNGATPAGVNQNTAHVGFTPLEVPMCMPQYMQMPMPMYPQPYQPQWNGNYMMNPMTSMTSSMQHTMQQIPLPQPSLNDTAQNLNQNSSE